MTKLKLNPMAENEMTDEARKANAAAIIGLDERIRQAQTRTTNAIVKAWRALDGLDAL